MNPPRSPLPLLIVGAGGHAAVTAEAALLAGFLPVAFLDDSHSARLSLPSLTSPSFPHPTPDHTPLPRAGGLADIHLLRSHPWVLALGSLPARHSFLSSLDPDALAHAVTVAHPTACISPSAILSPGIFIGPRAVIHARARIDAHAIINSGAIVEHDCRVGAGAHLAPASVLAGSVRVGRFAFVALGARVLPNLSIGDHAVAGAGSVVTRDVPAGLTVVGVPARPIRSPQPSVDLAAGPAD